MLKIKIKNFAPLRQSGEWQKKSRQLAALKAPDFVTHRPDFARLKQVNKKFKNIKQIIVVANGGSRNTTLALVNSLSHFYPKAPKFFFVSSGQPDYLAQISRQCPAANTLIFAVSKSGTNINSLEPLLYFIAKKYSQIVVITQDDGNPLVNIAQNYNFPIIVHPPISGRFSGRTSSTLAPASWLGLDVEKFNNDVVAAYKKYRQSALTVAQFLAQLNAGGYSEIFTPIYSQYVSGFLPLLVQLIHESTGQLGRGFTIFGDAGPETQHHTNQRFFGGQQNVVGFFVRQLNFVDDKKIMIAKNLKNLPYRDGVLGQLDGRSLAGGLSADVEAVIKNTEENKIPHVVIDIDKWNVESAAEFLAFWQLLTYYLALLLNLDPFDQPQVERAKKISWQYRLSPRQK